MAELCPDVHPSTGLPESRISRNPNSKMEDCHIGSRKLLIPCRLNGDESPQELDLVFYAANTILETECRGINSDIRIRCLGTIMNMDFIA